MPELRYNPGVSKKARWNYGMGWKWWVNAYFRVLFSRELWFSWYFILLMFLMLLGLFQDEYTHWSDPILKALKCVFCLLILAVFFTSAGFLEAWIKILEKRRVERETAERIAHAQVHEQVQPPIEAAKAEEPKAEEPSPWMLGAWVKYLEEASDDKNTGPLV